MKKWFLVLAALALALWLVSVAVLLGVYRPDWFPPQFLKLELPTNTADFGQSFSVLDGLLSSLALVLGLAAILIQINQQADANVIGAFSVRQQFLLAESERLEEHIQSLKKRGQYDAALFNNMVEKKKRCLAECREIDDRLNGLLKKIK